jgi:3-oxoacyl-[acyl-carrier protein] reductase
MELGLAGRAALVTGASSGIGRATATALAREGVRVMLSARRREELEAAAAEARAAGGEADVVVSDLETVSGPRDAVEAAAARFGGLDILVNNGAPTAMGGLFEWQEDTYQQGFEGKALAYLRAARAAVPHMRAGGRGVIVNVAGLSARSANPGYVVGMMANRAIHALVRALSDELAPEGIRVLGLDPGAIATPRLLGTAIAHRANAEGVGTDVVVERFGQTIPLRRLGEPEDVADVITFLVSDRAAYMTGSTVIVDGGLSRSVD